MIRHDIYPARGRKLTIPYHESDNIVFTIRHDIYPARGRKLKNYCSEMRGADNDSPRYLPRKGTETAKYPYCEI